LENDHAALNKQNLDCRTSIATRYTLTAQALHWLTVLLILTTLPVIWVAVSLPEGQSQSRLLVVHRSLGVSIFVVALARILWRVRHTAPPLPGDTSWAMEFIRAALPTICFMPCSYSCLSPATCSQRTVARFHILDCSFFRDSQKNKRLGEVANYLHLLGQWGLYALVALHMLATVWHVAIQRDGLLSRMIPPQDNDSGPQRRR
jgi:cytochrome b561